MSAVRRLDAGDEPRPVIGVGVLNVSARGRELVMQTLVNNRLSYGPMTQDFERRVARIHDCRFGVMSNSGTSSLHIAVAALKEAGGWRDGDEVLVPSVTFIASSNVIIHNRLTPVFVDVERDFYGINPARLEKQITPRTRAILPVHLFGLPCDMDPILDVARRHQLKVIEDSCETMFARYKGRSVGAFGDIGCFSTYVAHLLVTGVGGLNTTNNPDYAVMLRSLMNHGRDSIYLSIDDDDDKGPDELRMIIERRFRFVHLGHSFRATEMEAALGLAELEHWQDMIAQRRRHAAILTKGLARHADWLQLPAIRAESEHSFMMYPLVLRGQPKTELVNYLEGFGVETRDMMPLIDQPVYQRMLQVEPADHPVAQWINSSGFYIGCHQGLSDSDLEYVIELFDRYARQAASAPVAASALVLVADGAIEQVREQLATIPLAIFKQVIVLRPGATGADAPGWPDGVEEHFIGSADPLRYLRGQLKGTDCAQVVYLAVDGRRNAADASKLLVALERGHDLVTASRFAIGGGRYDRDSHSPYRSAGNRVFTALANLTFNGHLTDVVNPFFAITRQRLLSAELAEDGLLGQYQLSLIAMKQGWSLAEVPTVEHVGLSRSERVMAWGRVLPMLWLLWKEWRTAPAARNS